MRKIILMMGISLDGFIEGPNREIDWHRVDDELHLYFNETLGAMGGFIDGRVVHELMAEYWPTADQDPEATPAMIEFARIWREKPKIVYSRTLQEVADGNTTVVRDVVADEVMALKAEPGGDLSLGGADLAASFMALGLIDEYAICVHPVVIGAGKPLFPAGQKLDLELIETRTFGNGVVLLRYRPASQPASQPA